MGMLSLGYSERLIMRFGARRRCCRVWSLVGAGLALFAQTSGDASYSSEVLPAMVLLGVGAGLSFPSMMTLAMTGVKPEEAGLASGLVNTTMQVGGALGLAVLATLSTYPHARPAGRGLLTRARVDRRLSPLPGDWRGTAHRITDPGHCPAALAL